MGYAVDGEHGVLRRRIGVISHVNKRSPFFGVYRVLSGRTSYKLPTEYLPKKIKGGLSVLSYRIRSTWLRLRCQARGTVAGS